MSPGGSLVDQSKNLEPRMDANERKYVIFNPRSSAFIRGSKFLLVLPLIELRRLSRRKFQMRLPCPATGEGVRDKGLNC
jgi:hypothetical protein